MILFFTKISLIRVEMKSQPLQAQDFKTMSQVNFVYMPCSLKLSKEND